MFINCKTLIVDKIKEILDRVTLFINEETIKTKTRHKFKAIDIHSKQKISLEAMINNKAIK